MATKNFRRVAELEQYINEGHSGDQVRINLAFSELQEFAQLVQRGRCPEDLYVRLSHEHIGPVGAQILATVIESPFCPSGLRIDLSGNGIGNVGAASLAAALKKHCPPRLQLYLSHNKISDTGLTAFAVALEHCLHGIHLYLAHNDITNRSIRPLAMHIRSGKWPVGAHIHLAHNAMEAESLAEALAVDGGLPPPDLSIDILHEGSVDAETSLSSRRRKETLLDKARKKLLMSWKEAFPLTFGGRPVSIKLIKVETAEGAVERTFFSLWSPETNKVLFPEDVVDTQEIQDIFRYLAMQEEEQTAQQMLTLIDSALSHADYWKSLTTFKHEPEIIADLRKRLDAFSTGEVVVSSTHKLEALVDFARASLMPRAPSPLLDRLPLPLLHGAPPTPVTEFCELIRDKNKEGLEQFIGKKELATQAAVDVAHVARGITHS